MRRNENEIFILKKKKLSKYILYSKLVRKIEIIKYDYRLYFYFFHKFNLSKIIEDRIIYR